MQVSKLALIVPLTGLLALAACGSNTEERAATGTLGGAVAGAVVGGPVGAVVGGAVGAAGGTALPKGADEYAGDAKDSLKRAPSTATTPTPTPAPAPKSTTP